jgi:guanine nucleotide-binding protein subunit beta-5
MATEALRPDPIQDSVEALSREAEQLKSKLDDERAKLNDVDCEYGVKFV